MMENKLRSSKNEEIKKLIEEKFSNMKDTQPVYAGCNVIGECYCTGACKRIIGYRKKNANPIHPTIEQARQ
jgi:hypothetical protein